MPEPFSAVSTPEFSPGATPSSRTTNRTGFPSCEGASTRFRSRLWNRNTILPGAAWSTAASEPTDDLVVCADTLDAGPGDDVIVAFGHAARVAVSEKLAPGDKPSVPIDAAVVAVVDRVEIPR